MIILIFTFLLSCVGLGSPVEVDTLSIYPDQVSGSDFVDGSEWRKICKVLGKSLSGGRGPFGSGPFKDFECEENPTHPWRLALESQGGRFKFLLYHHAYGIRSQVELNQSDYMLRCIDDGKFLDLLTLAILDPLPFIGKMTQVKPRNIVRVDEKHSIKSLNLYGLTFDKGFFHSEDLKTVHLTYSTKAQRAAFKLDSAPPRLPLFFHNSEGPGAGSIINLKALKARQSEITLLTDPEDPRLTSNSESPLGLLDDSPKKFGSSYFELRYGKQFTGSDPLMKKASMIGFFAEANKGMLRAWRLQYDYIPPISATVDNDSTSLMLRRYTVGRSFQLKPIFGYVVDFIPRLGVLQFNADIPAVSSTGTSFGVKEFKVNNGLSLGIEAGVKKTFFNKEFRGWYGYDFSSPLGNNSEATISNHRFGLDAQVFQTQFSKNSQINFILFANYEKMNLSKRDTELGATLDLSITSTYFGVGFGFAI